MNGRTHLQSTVHVWMQTLLKLDNEKYTQNNKMFKKSSGVNILYCHNYVADLLEGGSFTKSKVKFILENH